MGKCVLKIGGCMPMATCGGQKRGQKRVEIAGGKWRGVGLNVRCVCVEWAGHVCGWRDLCVGCDGDTMLVCGVCGGWGRKGGGMCVAMG